ncbi:MAG TPA: hypothetical protein VFW63_04885 [Acidimicrobiales bacterium]|nr:hypothetical protein [Acidimicrobiales bacterium]
MTATFLGRGGRSDERGSVLVLVPAALLIVLVLASVAVDMSLLHLRQRQAHDLAAAAANDAVTAGADRGVLRTGTYVVDRAAARRVVSRMVAASDLAPHVVGPPEVRVTADGVEVALALHADYIFAGVVPGTPDGRTVRAVASAVAASGGPSPAT